MDILHRIMTINMNGNGATEEQKKEIISNIKNIKNPPSVIFCQELQSESFMEKVVHEVSGKCGSDDYSYKIASSCADENGEIHAAVMWNKTDFKAEEVKCTDSPIKDILDRLSEEDTPVLGWVRERAFMVKLTSVKAKESFLAVSWHGPWKTKKKNQLKTKEHGLKPKELKLEALHVLICFLLKVCEKEELSSFIIGGDFNLNTSEVNLTKYFGLTMLSYNKKHRRGSVPYKDTFIVWVKVPSDKRPLTASSVKPHESETESRRAPPLDHEPVVGDLKILYKKPSIKQDRGTNTEDKTTNENGILELTPEKTQRGVGSEASGVSKKLDFEGASSSSSGQSSSASHDGNVTSKDLEGLTGSVKSMSLDSHHTKIDRETAEITEPKLAIQPLDGPHGSVSQAQHAEPHSQTTNVSVSSVPEQGSGKGTNTEDKTTNENGILELTPEKTQRGVGSEASGVSKKLDFEGASNSTSGQSPSASHDGYVTRKDFDRLMSLVETLSISVDRLHKKIDRQRDEIVEIKSAMQRPDCPSGSVSPAQHAEPNSQTSKVLASPDLDEGSDKESTFGIKKEEWIKKE